MDVTPGAAGNAVKRPGGRPWSRGTGGRRLALVTALLAVTFVGVSLVSPSFASLGNLKDLLVQVAPVVIVACGMTLVVIAGEIDVSVGSLLGMLGALLGIMSSPAHLGWPVWAVVGLTLLAGGAAGLVNGLLVTLGRVPSIIATLGMLTILRGGTEMLMGGEWITDLPPGIRVLGTGELVGIPICLWVAAGVIAASTLIARRSYAGLCIYAVGGNVAAAGMARISAGRVKVMAFTMLGVLTGIAALVSVPQQSVIESGIGKEFELVVITAVVVGGTSIRGGYGGIAGTVVAALLLGSIRTSLVFLNLGDMATYWERAIQGAFILAAVLSDHLGGANSRETAGGGA